MCEKVDGKEGPDGHVHEGVGKSWKNQERAALAGNLQGRVRDLHQALADLKVEYDELHTRYAAANYPCVIDGPSGPKKNPLVATLESLRRDILALETALGLNPTGLLKLQENAFAKPKKSRAADLTK